MTLTPEPAARNARRFWTAGGSRRCHGMDPRVFAGQRPASPWADEGVAARLGAAAPLGRDDARLGGLRRSGGVTGTASVADGDALQGLKANARAGTPHR